MKGNLKAVGIVLLAAFWLLIVSLSWSSVPYWPDAAGYTSHVAGNRWVAHPPGYPFFVWLGHGMHAAGLGAYAANQCASVFLTMAGVATAYLLARRYCGSGRALLLAGGLGFSWLTLTIVQTGTSHAADLFTVSFLLLAAIRLDGGRPGWGRAAVFGVAMVVCAGFRFTTLLMMGPLLLCVAWENRRWARFWVACVGAGLTVVLLQCWVIGESGGYAEYSAYSGAMHEANAFSSIVLKGITPASLVNVFRAGLWTVLGALVFLCIVGLKARPVEGSERTAVIYGAAASLGCFGVAAFYLCTHPGYLAAALPGLILVAAVMWGRQPGFVGVPAICAAVLGPVMFMVIRPYSEPQQRTRAIANGLLLQYGMTGARHGIFKTTSGWLREAGFERDIPANRLEDLRSEAEKERAAGR
jgi:hypothetical protein